MLERRLQLIELLVSSSNPISAAYLSKQLHVSRKTIYKDIESIRNIGKKYQITIESIPSEGIRLFYDNFENVQQLISEYQEDIANDSYTIEKRRTYIIKALMIQGQLLTLDFLSKKFYISKTSIYNDINRINEHFKPFDMTIASTQEGLIVKGEELHIQQALIELVFNLTQNNSKKDFKEIYLTLFDEIIVETIYYQLFVVQHELMKNISDYYIQSLVASLIILCSRVKLGYHLSSTKTIQDNHLNYDDQQIYFKLLTAFTDELDINFSSIDASYMHTQLFAHKMMDTSSDRSSELKSVVKQFIAQMSEIEGIDFSKDEGLLESVYDHIAAMVTRLRLGIHIQNPLLKNIKQDYPVLFNVTWYAASVLEAFYDIKLNDDEVSLLLIPFQINIEERRVANKILIICQYGISSAQLIKSRIKRFIPDEDILKVGTFNTLREEDFQDADLIISSIDSRVVKHV